MAHVAISGDNLTMINQQNLIHSIKIQHTIVFMKIYHFYLITILIKTYCHKLVAMKIALMKFVENGITLMMFLCLLHGQYII